MPPVGIKTITDNHSAIGAGLRIFALVRVRAVSGNALDHSPIREGPGIFD